VTSRLLGTLIAGLLVLALVPSPARSDGDPASDILVGESVFYPYAPPVSNGLQRTLNAETAAATRAGLPLKVALIASPTDLGAIPELFGKPQQYAQFLDQEISFLSPKPVLLVVMAGGYGAAGPSRQAIDAVRSLARPDGGQSDELARAAIAAVPKLAAAAGHPVTAVSSAPGAGSSHGASVLDAVSFAVAAVVLAAAAVLVRRRRAAHSRRPHR
jgi:hypothetical protein